MLFGEEEGGRECVGALVAGNAERIQAEYAETCSWGTATRGDSLFVLLSGSGSCCN